MLTVLHHIEDLQVICFAVIFGLMALQTRKDQTIRYACCSYLLASLVSVMDVGLRRPFSPFVSNLIFFIICVRYVVLTLAMVRFTRRSQWLLWPSAGLAAASLGLVLGTPLHVTQGTVTALFRIAFGLQAVILVAVVVRSKETATRMPRIFLACLFTVSMACRFTQAWVDLRLAGVNAAWWQDEAAFLNTTLVGCLVPFAIIWIMHTRIQRDLRVQSHIDPLTELLNRRGLLEVAHREMARYSRARQNFAVVAADIDHFKKLNDTHGHACGDEVLRAIAQVFKEELRQSDIISRSGGEEFVLLLPLTGEMESMAVTERVRQALEHRAIEVEDGITVKTTISAGISFTDGRQQLTWEALQHEADQALYRAKRSGRNRVVRYTPSAAEGTTLESDIDALPVA